VNDPRRWLPGVPDLTFAVVLAITMVGGYDGFLNDPGTGWHLRLGREILRTGAVPRVDTLSDSRAGMPWVDQSWLFDLGLAVVVDRVGLAGAVGLAALGLAWVYASLARELLAQGRRSPTALVVALAAAGIGSIHFLLRPHLFTLALASWTFAASRRHFLGHGRSLLALPMVMIAWANLHGGFIAGPVIVATGLAAECLAGPWDRARRRRLKIAGGVLAASMLTPLVNPYGIGLYRHVLDLLVTLDVTNLIVEYQPAPLGRPTTWVAELALIGLIVLPALSRRKARWHDLAQAVVWLHFGFATIRNLPLFGLAMAPALAGLIDGTLRPERDQRRLLRRWTAWAVGISVVVVVAAATGVPFGRPDPAVWPVRALPALDRQPTGLRFFHEQDWGGLIAERCEPSRPVYIDDRFELYGRAMVMEYVEALRGGPEWDRLCDREGFDLVWVKPRRGLARRLATDPGWREVHRDDVSVLFRKRAGDR